MNHVLLTSIYIPLGNEADEGKSVGTELLHKSLTRAQGIFSIRQVIRCWSNDYIAANLDTPVTVFHYPTVRKFKKELKRNHYTHIGISFVVPTFLRMVEMVRIIREISPGTAIILGGYGTVLGDDVLKPHCDYICRGDGVPFMRELLGEKTDAPARHPYAPVKGPRVLSFTYPGKMLHITAGLGCPNGCDFCSTSHFYSRRYYPLVENGKELYSEILNQYRKAKERGDKVSHLAIIDEDLFHSETRAREFLEEARKHQACIGLSGFASIRGLSKFTGREIAEMGFELLWVGIEGKNAAFNKLNGRSAHDLFEDFKDHGISTIASSIIGLPYQTRDSIREDFERHIQLKPTYSQFFIYCPVFGTPLFEKSQKENRLIPGIENPKNWKRMEGFSQFIKHDHFEDGELEKIQEDMYREEYERLGASVFRVGEILLRGSINMEKSDSPLLRMKAGRLKKYAGMIRPLLPIGRWLAPSKDAKHIIDELGHRYRQVCGRWDFPDIVKAMFTPSLALTTYIRFRSGYDDRLGSLRIDKDQL